MIIIYLYNIEIFFRHSIILRYCNLNFFTTLLEKNINEISIFVSYILSSRCSQTGLGPISFHYFHQSEWSEIT